MYDGAAPGVYTVLWGRGMGLFLAGGFKKLEHLDGAYGNTCAGAEDGGNACRVEEVVVLSRYHTAGSYEDILAAGGVLSSSIT